MLAIYQINSRSIKKPNTNLSKKNCASVMFPDEVMEK